MNSEVYVFVELDLVHVRFQHDPSFEGCDMHPARKHRNMFCTWAVANSDYTLDWDRSPLVI